MKRTVPLFITAIAGFVLIVSTFLPAIQEWGENAAVWFDILAAIAFILGGGNLLKLHLKAVSDQKAGWGYSVVTVVSFLLMMFFGLSKMGSLPLASEEAYGESFAHLPISAMPEYRVPGSIPNRADHAPLPASVLRQLREEDGEIVFQGWMSKRQRDDLFDHKQILAWQCQVEQLFELAQPPKNLDEKIKYYPEHKKLSVKGILSDDLRENLKTMLPESPEATQAIEELNVKSHLETVIDVPEFPQEFEIPEELRDVILQQDNQLIIVGPMSAGLRDQIAKIWAGFPLAMPMTDAEEQELKTQLEVDGSRLTEEQAGVFKRFFATEWDASLLIGAIDTAAIPEKEEKTYCELLAEQTAGVTELSRKKATPDPVFLNEPQQELVRTFVHTPGFEVDDFKTQLASLGTLTETQLAAIDKFLEQLPLRSKQYKDLGIELLKVGPLSQAQREILFGPYAEAYAWQTTVGRLFVAAHQVKYPWSGDINDRGHAFWWSYEYILQPLMTTTFAMLAFYVASAAFRAFRAKNLEAALLLGTAFIVLLGRTYLGVQLTAWVPDALSALRIDQMTVYIMKIFNTAGNRAIMIGIALGIASTSLKVLLGIDRSYLGSGDD